MKTSCLRQLTPKRSVEITLPLLPEKQKQKVLTAQVTADAGVKFSSLDAWVAFEMRCSPDSKAREAARRIQDFQNGVSKELRLSNLFLHSVPPLTGCRRLENYDLSGNLLHCIPCDLGCLPNLKYLNLESNLLRQIPSLNQYPELKFVGLSLNPLRRFPRALERRGVWILADNTLLTFEDWLNYLGSRFGTRLHALAFRLCPMMICFQGLPPRNNFEYPPNWHKKTCSVSLVRPQYQHFWPYVFPPTPKCRPKQSATPTAH